MPKRVPVQRVIVQREGKQFVPKIGETFDFTAEEIDDINRMNPDAVRKPIVETTAEETGGEKAGATKPAAKTTKSSGSADL